MSQWLLLIHQIPPKPTYLRVKVWRRLQRLGAVAIKNSVYALPVSEQAHEDLEWILREIVAGGGDASLCEARFVEGLTDDAVIALFHAARESDYDELLVEAQAVAARAEGMEATDPALAATLVKLERRQSEIAGIDFFGAPGREKVAGVLAGIAARVRSLGAPGGSIPSAYRGRIWVTRSGVKVDRIASAWLIRRCIDPDAVFKFVDSGSAALPGELRFDMYQAEFTHEGDQCTFEVLVDRFGLATPALRAVAEIIHDIDLKDAKFGREETQGIAALIAGLAARHADDVARLARGSELFEELTQWFESR